MGGRSGKRGQACLVRPALFIPLFRGQVTIPTVWQRASRQRAPSRFAINVDTVDEKTSTETT